MSGFAVAMILVGTPAAAEGGGFNPFEFAFGATFWTWTIFLLSLWPMWKFVFGPITKALGDRDGDVIEAARSAEQAKREAEKAVAAARQELEHARGEGKRMVQEATARAERQGQEERRKAKLEAEQYLLKAREEIEAEKRRALGEIRREVVDLAVASASRILRREVDTEQHRALVGDFLKGLDERSN